MLLIPFPVEPILLFGDVPLMSSVRVALWPSMDWVDGLLRKVSLSAALTRLREYLKATYATQVQSLEAQCVLWSK